jgi:hypothetical protein
MPLLQTKSLMKKGETFLPVEMRMPPGRVKKYKTELIHFYANTIGEDVDYAMDVHFNPVDPHVYTFQFETLYTGSRTGIVNVQKLINRIDSQTKRAAAHFQMVKKLPTITRNKITMKFKITMPPHTLMASSDPFFFKNVLGLTMADEYDVQVPPMTHPAKVYGFLNATDIEESYIATEPRKLEDVLRTKLPSGVVIPASNTEMIIQLMHWVVHKKLKKPIAPTLSSSAEIMEKLINEALATLSLPPGMINVYETQDGLVMYNVVYPNYKYVITINLGETLMRYFGRTEELNFPIEKQNSFVLKATDATIGQDPFTKHYPISAVWSGFGEGTSFIQGRGTESILAFIKSSNSLKSFDSYIVNGDSKLKLFFIDKNLKIVKISDNTKICLTFQMVPL